MFNKTFYRFVSLVICILMIAVSGTNLLAKSQSANVDVRPMADDSDWGAPDDGYYEYYKGYRVHNRTYLWKDHLVRYYLEKYGETEGEFKLKLAKDGANLILDLLLRNPYITVVEFLIKQGFSSLSRARNLKNYEVTNILLGILDKKYKYAVITTVYDPKVGYKDYIDGIY